MILVIGSDLFQWDLGRSVIYTPEDGSVINELHFANRGDAKALVMEAVAEDGTYTAEIPNILLQTGKAICVWAVISAEENRSTVEQVVFPVRKRERPADYVYTQTEVKSYTDLEDRIKALEENGTGSGGSSTLIVTVTDDVASHTSADIALHVQSGGNILLHYQTWYYNLLAIDEQGGYGAVFGNTDDEGLTSVVIVTADGGIENYEYEHITYAGVESIISQSQATSDVARSVASDFAYSKVEADELIDGKQPKSIVFSVTYPNETETYSHTIAELWEAYQAGCSISCEYFARAGIYHLKSASESEFVFDRMEGADSGYSYVTITYDGTDASLSVTQGGGVKSVNGKTGSVKLTAEDVGALPKETEIPTVPTNVSAFTNDAGYVKETGIPVPTTAEVGQTIVVKAVDTNGKPTEWECADMASGGSGGGETFELIASGELTEETTTINITADNNGNAFKLRRGRFMMSIVGTATNTTDNGALRVRHNYNTAAKGSNVSAMSRIRNAETKFTEFYGVYEFFPDIPTAMIYYLPACSAGGSVPSAVYDADWNNSPYLSALYLQGDTSNANMMGVGTKWELWGVRA